MKQAYTLILSFGMANVVYAGPVEQIAAQYTKIDPYFIKMDSAGLTSAFKAMCTRDFLNINSQGNQTLPQIMKLIDSNFKTMKKVDTYKTTVKSLKIIGTKGTMLASHRWIFEGKDNHKVDFTEYVSDIWVKQPAGWKLKSETTIDQKIFVDGKSVQPSKAVTKKV